MIDKSFTFSLFTTDSESSHYIKLVENSTQYNKIDSKFIPTMALYKSYSVEPVSLSKTDLGEPLDPKELADLLKNYSCFVVNKFSPLPLPSSAYDYIEYMPISTFREYYSYADLVAIECFCISYDNDGSIIKYLNGVIPPS